MERSPNMTGVYMADITLRTRIMVVASDAGSAHEVARTATRARASASEIHEVVITPMSATEYLDLRNIVSWQEMETLRTHGTANDRHLWMQLRLPESALVAIAKREVFRPLATFSRHRQTGFADIDHPKNSRNIWECLINWKTGPANIIELVTLHGPEIYEKLAERERREFAQVEECAEDMRSHPWLLASRRFVGNPVSLQVREHRCSCRACGRSISRRTALVTVSWAGRYLEAEYIL